MFKADLIENQLYYGLRRNQLIALLVLSALLGLFSQFWEIPFWIIAILVGVLLIIRYKMHKNQKKISSLLGARQITMTPETIVISSTNGTILESFKLEDLNKIILKEIYSMPQENLKEVGKELTGKVLKNYITLQQKDKVSRFDFELNSYYTIEQLKKTIQSWKDKKYAIEVESTK